MDESNRQKSWRLGRLVWFAPAMEGQVQIRTAGSKDVPQILAIYNAAVLEPASAYEDVPHTLTQREEWFEQFTRRNFPVVVAEHGSVVVGWGSLGPHQERAGFRFTGSVAVYVVGTHRRYGIGGELVEALLSAGRERKIHAVVAAIDSRNEASLKLHAKYGFMEAGVFQEVGCKFGEWRDVVYMQRLLDDRASPDA